MSRWILVLATSSLLVACKTDQKNDASDLATKANSTDLTALEARVTTLESEVSALQASNSSLTTSMNSMATNLTTVTNDVTTLQGDVSGPTVQLIDSDQTINLSPGDSLSDALHSLAGESIEGGVTVTLQLAAGTYTLDNTVSFGGKNGWRIHILGDTSDPSQVILHYTGDGVALRAANGGRLGLLDGVTLEGDDHPDSLGIVASQGGEINVGSHVVVQGFGLAGFVAWREGILIANGTTSKSNGTGYAAYQGGFIQAQGAKALENDGPGFDAGQGGVLAADDPQNPADAENNNDDGFTAEMGSVLAADGATTSANAGFGFQAHRGSALKADNTASTGDVRGGYWTFGSSYMSVDHTSAIGDTNTASPDSAGYRAGSTSTIELGPDGATAKNYNDGFQAAGNGFMNIANDPADAENNTNYGYNVFLGGWMLTGSSTTAANNGAQDYNYGPVDSMPDTAAWGVIFY